MELATAYVAFEAKTDKVKPQVTKALTEAGDAGGKAGGKAAKEGFDKGTQGIGKQTADTLKNVFVGGAAIAGIKSIVTAASNLNETVSKVGVIFGDQASAVEDFASTADKALGQSKQTALDAAANFAVFGKAAGLAGGDLTEFSTKTTTLASDLASFFNTRPEDAITAIGAAFRGESEPIRQYGVLLNDATLKSEAMKQGLIANTNEALTPQQRVLAAYQVILQQTTDAQGDFARTSDGAANKQRILAAEFENTKAELGQSLLPIFQELLGVLSKVVSGFNALPEPIKLAVLALAAFAALRGPVGQMLGAIKLIGPAIAAGGLPLAALIGTIGALAIVLSDAGDILDESKAEFKGFSQAANDLSKNTKSAFSDLEKQVLGTDHLTQSLAQLGLTVEDVQAMLASGLTPGDIVAQLTAAGDSSEATAKAIASLGTALTGLGWSEQIAGAAQLNGALKTLGQDALVQSAKDAGASDEALTEFAHALYTGSLNATILSQTGIPLAATLENVRQKLAEAKAEAADAGTNWSALADESGVLTDSTDVLAQKLDAASTAANNLKSALDAVFQPAESLNDATENLYQNAEDLRVSLEKNGRTIDINTEAGRKNRDQIQTSIDGYKDYAVALVNSGASQEEATGKLNFYIAALRQQLIDSGLSEQAVDEYINTLNLTPENVTTAIALANQAQAKADVETWLKNVNPVSKGGTIPDEVVSAIKALMDRGSVNEAKAAIQNVETNGGQGYTAVINLLAVGQQAIRNIIASLTGGSVPHSASGRLVTQPMLSTLGESGPEVVLNAQQATNVLWAVANNPQVATGPGSSSQSSIDARVIVQGNVYGDDHISEILDRRNQELAFALRAR